MQSEANEPGNGFVELNVAGIMKGFEDHFSQRAETYHRYRPAYPRELFAYLASIAPHRELAWDCGTGNGQAALGLVDYFDRVAATDASSEQLALAMPHDRIDYSVARSEDSALAPASVALATVAVAVHWFDLESFYAEVRRVLTPKGVIAVWCYSLPSITPGIDTILKRYLQNTLADYWPERFRYVRDQYRTLPFPFEELTPPAFSMETAWDLTDVLGFLTSWSGTATYEKRHGFNPVDLIRPDLRREWGGTKERILFWRLHLRVGLVP